METTQPRSSVGSRRVASTALAAAGFVAGILFAPTLATAADKISDVVVANTTSNPVPVVDVNRETPLPVSEIHSISMPFGVLVVPESCYTVPPGKRLVLEQASVRVGFDDPAEKLTEAYVSVIGTNDTFMVIPATEAAGTGDWRGSQYGRLYAYSFDRLVCLVARDSAASPARAIFSLTGYLVNAP